MGLGRWDSICTRDHRRTPVVEPLARANPTSSTAEIAVYPSQVYAITAPLSWENVGWAGFEPATSASRTGLRPC
jgi:hypothetical protein